jgi:dolichol-phosphate mannosyltransferase
VPARVLITGAAGFVGANLARRMLARGDELWLAVRPGSDRWRLREIEGDARIVEVDLREPEAASKVVGEARPRFVMHLAAHGAYSWQTESDRIFETNAMGTRRLLEACAGAGVECLVHAGSSSEYGYKDHAPGESELPEPNSDYAVAKLAATMSCAQFARERDLRTVTLRLYAAYGPWEHPERLVPTLVRAAMRGELPPLVSPDVARDFVFVDDVCSAFVLASESTGDNAGGVYNVASGSQTTIREIVETARSLFGVEAEPDWGSMPERGWDTTTWVGDPTLIRRELGWHPEVDITDGLSRMAEWIAKR